MSSDKAAARLFHGIPKDKSAKAAKPRRPRRKRGRTAPGAVEAGVIAAEERSERARQAVIARDENFRRADARRMPYLRDAATAAAWPILPGSARLRLPPPPSWDIVPRIIENENGELQIFPEISEQEKEEERQHHGWMIRKNEETQRSLEEQLRRVHGHKRDNIERTLRQTRKRRRIFNRGTIRQDKERRLREFSNIPEGTQGKEIVRRMLLGMDSRTGAPWDSREYKRGGKTIRRKRRKRRGKTRKRKRRGKTRKRKRRGKTRKRKRRGKTRKRKRRGKR